MIRTTQDIEWFSAADSAVLPGGYFATLGRLALREAVVFYDLFLVGMVVALVGPGWHLTFYAAAAMLGAGGAGGMIGAAMFAALAPRIGERSLTGLGAILAAAGAVVCALVRDGDWTGFALARLVIGCGLTGVAAIQADALPRVMPTRFRRFFSSLLLAPVCVGMLLSALVAATLLPVLGWRGFAATGSVAILVAFALPPGVTAQASPEPRRPRQSRRLSLVWFCSAASCYGVLLWGPVLLAMPPRNVALWFGALALVSIAGRVAFAVLPLGLGRRRCGAFMGFGSAAILLAAALLHGGSMLVLLMVGGSAFYCGGFANLLPAVVEARAVGLAQIANGAGAIIGAVCLALFAGGSHIVSAAAAGAAGMPAFLVLACSSLLAGAAMMGFAHPTHDARSAAEP